MLKLEQKKQFTFFIFDKNISTGPSTKVALSQAGFDAHYFNETGVIKGHVETNTPHVIFLDVSSLDEPLSELMSFFNRISPEIFYVFISDLKSFDQLKTYEPFGLFYVVSNQGDFFEDRMVLLANRICEEIYLTYQNEQIYEELKKIKNENLIIGEEIRGLKKQSLSNASVPSRIKDYLSADSLEALVLKFLNQFKERPIIYFKYIEEVRSLIALSAQGMEISKLSGVGVQVEVKELQSFYEQLLIGLAPSKIIDAVSALLGDSKLKSYPVYVSEKLQGLFMTVDQDLEIFEAEMSLFSLAFSNLNLEKRLDMLDVRDVLTGLQNQKNFISKLNEEVTRAIRKKGHFSVVKIGIDQLEQIAQEYGELIRDESLKLLGYYLQKLCRASDEVFRTGYNEFSVFLPDTTKEEAAVFSERIRRYFLTNSVSDKGFQSSLSFGISEYPSLAQSVESIDTTATKALLHVQSQGGNKICFYKKPT